MSQGAIMKRAQRFVLSVFAASLLAFGLGLMTQVSATTAASTSASNGAFDYEKCIASCDAQYARCAKGGDADKIKYCSGQHDSCRNGCLKKK
jgi:hypothetical protein